MGIFYQVFPGFHAVPQLKKTQHGFLFKTANVDLENILIEVVDTNLNGENYSCETFFVDCELKRTRQKVSNIAIEDLTATIVDKKRSPCQQFKCATKMNLVFGFILKNVEVGSFSCIYAHGNNSLLKRLKPNCTKNGLTKLKEFFNKTEVTDCRVVEKQSLKSEDFPSLQTTVLGALLKHVRMGCKEAVSVKTLLRNCTYNCHVLERKQVSYTKKTCAIFVFFYSIYKEIKTCKTKHLKFSIYSLRDWMESALFRSLESP